LRLAYKELEMSIERQNNDEKRPDEGKSDKSALLAV
jgi:hypothetical protein